MNIDRILAEMDAAHKEKMAEMDAEYKAEENAHKARMKKMADEHEAEMEKLRAEREAVEAEIVSIDAEIAHINAEIEASKERTKKNRRMFEAAQERLLQARTKEEYAAAYADLMSASEALFKKV